MKIQRLNLLESTHGRLLTFGLLYLSEGIAYGFSATAIVAFMRTEGLSLSQIGAFTAALLFPWSFKWAWAPIVDLVKLNRVGGRKAWIFLCTAMMIVMLVILALVDFRTEFQLLLWLIVLNNLFCATQDVAIDSLAVSTLHVWRAIRRYRAWRRRCCLRFRALGLKRGSLDVSAMLTASLAFVLVFVWDPDIARGSRCRRRDTASELAANFFAFIRELYRSFLNSGSGPRIGLVFAILPTGAMAMAYAMLGSLQVDYGLTQTQIATLSVYNTIVTAAGCVGGGWFADRFGIKPVLGLFFMLTAVPTLLLAGQISAHGLSQVALPLFSGTIVFWPISRTKLQWVGQHLTDPATLRTEGSGNKVTSTA